MSTVEVTKHLSENAPHIGSRLIAAYYLLTVMTGAFLVLFHGRLAFAADLVVGVFYLLATAFLYGLSAANKRKERR